MFSCTTNRRKLDIAKSSKQHVDGLKAAPVLLPVLDDSYTPGVPPTSQHDLLPMVIRQKMLIINIHETNCKSYKSNISSKKHETNCELYN
jgi:hypothetical protein